MPKNDQTTPDQPLDSASAFSGSAGPFASDGAFAAMMRSFDPRAMMEQGMELTKTMFDIATGNPNALIEDLDTLCPLRLPGIAPRQKMAGKQTDRAVSRGVGKLDRS